MLGFKDHMDQFLIDRMFEKEFLKQSVAVNLKFLWEEVCFFYGPTKL